MANHAGADNALQHVAGARPSPRPRCGSRGGAAASGQSRAHVMSGFPVVKSAARSGPPRSLHLGIGSAAGGVFLLAGAAEFLARLALQALLVGFLGALDRGGAVDLLVSGGSRGGLVGGRRRGGGGGGG